VDREEYAGFDACNYDRAALFERDDFSLKNVSGAQANGFLGRKQDISGADSYFHSFGAA
jgi:hypothetical protein